MLQRDIATPDMDVRYVSALSWYFLNLFGLNGLFKLMLGSENAADGTRDMGAQAMMAGAGGPMMGQAQVDMNKVFRNEAENLAIADGLYAWAGQGVEDRVLNLFGRAVNESESKKTR